MPKPKPASGSGSSAASGRVLLAYAGDASGNPYLSGIPARDLTEADLVHLAFRGGTDADGLIAALIASGFYAPSPEGKVA